MIEIRQAAGITAMATYPSAWSHQVVAATDVPTPRSTVSAAANRNHFSCARSMPRLRRNRTTSDAIEHPTATRNRRNPIGVRTSTTVDRRITGFTNAGSTLAPPEPSGLRIPVTNVRVIAAPASHKTGRHRLDGGRPSGNSRTRNVGIANHGGTHAHWL